MNLTTMRTLRWVLVGFGLVAAALLVATGNLVVLGVAIGGLALLRLVLLLGVQRRRLRFRSTGGAARTGDVPPVLRTLVRGQFEVAAGAIGVPPSELRIEFARGHSIAEVASARGVPVETVVAAVVADASAKVDRAVAEGETPAGAAVRIKHRLPRWATRMVNGHRGDARTRVAGSA